MIKIYFSNKPVFLVKDTAQVADYLQRQSTILLDDLHEQAVDTMISEIQKQEIEAGVFLNNDESAVLEAFKNQMHVITAAGGFVYTPEKKALLIFRRGKWDLPKGKLDGNEDLSTCAIREVKEETGLKQLHLNHSLITTYHSYPEGHKHALKETHWFLMDANEQKLTPQTKEDIEKAEWVSADQLQSYLQNTYALIHDVTNAALEHMR